MYVMEYHVIGVQENELLLFTSSPTSPTRAYMPLKYLEGRRYFEHWKELNRNNRNKKAGM